MSFIVFNICMLGPIEYKFYYSQWKSIWVTWIWKRASITESSSLPSASAALKTSVAHSDIPYLQDSLKAFLGMSDLADFMMITVKRCWSKMLKIGHELISSRTTMKPLSTWPTFNRLVSPDSFFIKPSSLARLLINTISSLHETDSSPLRSIR